ncbi:hypothetical protein [Agromyces humatus]|uniref:Uncharacterized protein n=1 Tax=Agromyces humatus TaxID=279573 RepID=A0ABN2KXY8_9MICO|nr:hypothetical protein [Agromyces humatus]
MSTEFGSIEKLIAERGTIRGREPVIEPQAAADGGVVVIHHYDTVTYKDKLGHWHAVLLDTVTSGPNPGSASQMVHTIEILSDQVIT